MYLSIHVLVVRFKSLIPNDKSIYVVGTLYLLCAVGVVDSLVSTTITLLPFYCETGLSRFGSW